MPNSSTTLERRKEIKIGAYYGHTPLETFIAKFSNAAEYNGWSEDDCLANMKASLTGGAANVLWDTPKSKYDSSGILLRSGIGILTAMIKMEEKSRQDTMSLPPDDRGSKADYRVQGAQKFRDSDSVEIDGWSSDDGVTTELLWKLTQENTETNAATRLSRVARRLEWLDDFGSQ